MDALAPEPATANDAAIGMSWSARLVNIYAAPADVFETVRQTVERRPGNWFVPAILSCVAGVAFAWIALSQPNVEQQIRERQDEKIEEQVQSGKMSAADADAARTRVEEFNIMPLMKIFGSVGAVAMGFGMIFFAALLLKGVAGLWLGAPVEYMKCVEVAGLSSMVQALGTLVQLLLIILNGSLLATPGPVLLVGDIDPQNKLHLALSAVNLMTIWYVCLLAAGLAKLVGAAFGRVFLPLIALWVLWHAGLIALGWGASGMGAAGLPG